MTTSGRQIDRDAYRDMLGAIDLHFQQDFENRNLLMEQGNLPRMFLALIDASLGLANISTDGRPEQWITYLREHIDDMLDVYQRHLDQGDGQ